MEFRGSSGVERCIAQMAKKGPNQLTPFNGRHLSPADHVLMVDGWFILSDQRFSTCLYRTPSSLSNERGGKFLTRDSVGPVDVPEHIYLGMAGPKSRRGRSLVFWLVASHVSHTLKIALTKA
jgi:hypothetical protein